MYVAPPEPEAYVAERAGVVFRSSVGVPPASVTGLLNVTRTWIVCPALYEPSAFEAETESTVGAVVSISMFFWPPRPIRLAGVRRIGGRQTEFYNDASARL